MTNSQHLQNNAQNALSRLDKLKKQKAVIEARIQATEARNKNNQRKQDTRRKILVGSYYLDKAKQNHQLEEIKTLMNTYLKRNSDRKLFELPLLPER